MALEREYAVPFEISQEVRPQARIVSVCGDFDLASANLATEVLTLASADPQRSLVIDLMTCEFIDSTGLAVVVGAARPLINGQVKVAIACAEGSPVARLLRLSGVDQTIPVLNSLEEAVQRAIDSD
jgi:anti-anti-sigma factor